MKTKVISLTPVPYARIPGFGDPDIVVVSLEQLQATQKRWDKERESLMRKTKAKPFVK